ncbi:Intersectin-1 [Smittium mucronatum]|uniref:Intersectin-1 n=1 Tax=Smittium mucronatum TaxID=133383 RepID=A0A1R0H0V9_9FUNG|nr:Intersectin-1 [Smittium mucronatum]
MEHPNESPVFKRAQDHEYPHNEVSLPFLEKHSSIERSKHRSTRGKLRYNYSNKGKNLARNPTIVLKDAFEPHSLEIESPVNDSYPNYPHNERLSNSDSEDYDYPIQIDNILKNASYANRSSSQKNFSISNVFERSTPRNLEVNYANNDHFPRYSNKKPVDIGTSSPERSLDHNFSRLTISDEENIYDFSSNSSGNADYSFLHKNFSSHSPANLSTKKKSFPKKIKSLSPELLFDSDEEEHLISSLSRQKTWIKTTADIKNSNHKFLEKIPNKNEFSSEILTNNLEKINCQNSESDSSFPIINKSDPKIINRNKISTYIHSSSSFSDRPLSSSPSLSSLSSKDSLVSKSISYDVEIPSFRTASVPEGNSSLSSPISDSSGEIKLNTAAEAILSQKAQHSQSEKNLNFNFSSENFEQTPEIFNSLSFTKSNSNPPIVINSEMDIKEVSSICEKSPKPKFKGSTYEIYKSLTSASQNSEIFDPISEIGLNSTLVSMSGSIPINLNNSYSSHNTSTDAIPSSLSGSIKFHKEQNEFVSDFPNSIENISPPIIHAGIHSVGKNIRKANSLNTKSTCPSHNNQSSFSEENNLPESRKSENPNFEDVNDHSPSGTDPHYYGIHKKPLPKLPENHSELLLSDGVSTPLVNYDYASADSSNLLPQEAPDTDEAYLESSITYQVHDIPLRIIKTESFNNRPLPEIPFVTANISDKALESEAPSEISDEHTSNTLKVRRPLPKPPVKKNNALQHSNSINYSELLTTSNSNTINLESNNCNITQGVENSVFLDSSAIKIDQADNYLTSNNKASSLPIIESSADNHQVQRSIPPPIPNVPRPAINPIWYKSLVSESLNQDQTESIDSENHNGLTENPTISSTPLVEMNSIIVNYGRDYSSLPTKRPKNGKFYGPRKFETKNYHSVYKNPSSYKYHKLPDPEPFQGSYFAKQTPQIQSPDIIKTEPGTSAISIKQNLSTQKFAQKFINQYTPKPFVEDTSLITSFLKYCKKPLKIGLDRYPLDRDDSPKITNNDSLLNFQRDKSTPEIENPLAEIPYSVLNSHPSYSTFSKNLIDPELPSYDMNQSKQYDEKLIQNPTSTVIKSDPIDTNIKECTKQEKINSNPKSGQEINTFQNSSNLSTDNAQSSVSDSISKSLDGVSSFYGINYVHSNDEINIISNDVSITKFNSKKLDAPLRRKSNSFIDPINPSYESKNDYLSSDLVNRSNDEITRISKRREAIMELYHTEVSYANDIGIMIEAFYNPIQKLNEPSLLDLIFGNIQTIATVSVKICSLLENVLEPARIFHNLNSVQEMYFSSQSLISKEKLNVTKKHVIVLSESKSQIIQNRTRPKVVSLKEHPAYLGNYKPVRFVPSVSVQKEEEELSGYKGDSENIRKDAMSRSNSGNSSNSPKLSVASTLYSPGISTRTKRRISSKNSFKKLCSNDSDLRYKNPEVLAYEKAQKNCKIDSEMVDEKIFSQSPVSNRARDTFIERSSKGSESRFNRFSTNITPSDFIIEGTQISPTDTSIPKKKVSNRYSFDKCFEMDKHKDSETMSKTKIKKVNSEVAMNVTKNESECELEKLENRKSKIPIEANDEQDSEAKRSEMISLDIFDSLSIGTSLMEVAGEFQENYIRYSAVHRKAVRFLKSLYDSSNAPKKLIGSESAKLNYQLNEIISECEKNPKTRRLDLQSFLFLPIQRLTRYPLLLRAILKYTNADSDDHMYLSSTIVEFDRIISEVDSRSDDLASDERLESIKKALSNSRFDNMIPDICGETLEVGKRKVLMEGKLHKVYSSRSLYGFLFNDMFLLTMVEKVNGENFYSPYLPPVNLSDLIVRRPISETGSFFYPGEVFEIYNVSTKKSINLRGPSKKLTSQWMEILSESSKIVYDAVYKKISEGLHVGNRTTIYSPEMRESLIKNTKI